MEYVIYTNPTDPLQAQLITRSAVSMMAVAMAVLASWSDGKNDSVPLFRSLGVENFSAKWWCFKDPISYWVS